MHDMTPARIGRAIGADFEAVAERCGRDVHTLALIMRRPLMRTRKARRGTDGGRPSMEELSAIWQAIRAEQESPSYVDARTLAAEAGVTKGTVLGWIRRGRLHAERSALDGHLRVPAAEAERVKAERGGTHGQA